MKIADIRRQVLAAEPETFDEPISTLATEAKELLGYTRLETAITASRIPEKTTTLTQVLARLDIPILDFADVKMYQIEHRQEVESRRAKDLLGSRESLWRLSYPPHWGTQEIQDYKEPIPEFVLDMAVRIKKELPTIQFTVEFMEESPDPFLIAKLGNEEHYIAVWEEPKFEGRIAK